MGLVTPGLGLIIWMSISFLIVLFLLKKFAWKPILNSLSERENKIDEALRSAQRAEERMNEIEAKNQNLLAEAAKEREAMLKAARDASAQMIAEAKEKAAEESAKMLEQARETIHNEKMRAVTDIKNEVGKLSIEIAEKLLRENLSTEAKQNENIQRLLNDVNFN
ncbi:MAG: F0F1 ATP synthase subunit B [Flavobacteriales bacterium]|nr:F0F1 ATP synthase subunit B [Flavobacteriales bacterium]